MDLLQFVTPSSAATGPPQEPELDSAALLVFLDAYQVRWCTLHIPTWLCAESAHDADSPPNLCEVL